MPAVQAVEAAASEPQAGMMVGLAGEASRAGMPEGMEEASLVLKGASEERHTALQQVRVAAALAFQFHQDNNIAVAVVFS